MGAPQVTEEQDQEAYKEWEEPVTSDEKSATKVEKENTQDGYEDHDRTCLCKQFERRRFLYKLADIATVQFDWVTFVKELVYHMFFPLTLPLIAAWEGGSSGIINRQFWDSWLSFSQWAFSLSFYAVNVLTLFYVSPDIVIVNVLWVVRSLVLATKYGFIRKSEMAEMRRAVLPATAHRDRTLVLAWSNPIPLRVLKQQLLLAAVRKDLVKCTLAIRVVSGCSEGTVHTIMNQLSDLPMKRDSEHSAVSFFGLDKSKYKCCSACSSLGATDKGVEELWIQVCMDHISRNPPQNFLGNLLLQHDKGETAVHASDDAPSEKSCPAVDIPALFLAAYILQRSGYLLSKKKVLHQIFASPRRLYWTANIVGLIHTIIPFAARAVAGEPSVFGGHSWYNILVSISSFAINYTSMSFSVQFMLSGAADFRRRYFAARLMNCLLKDGCYGEDRPVCRPHNKWSPSKGKYYHLGLSIDFLEETSIVGWWVVRVLVQDFGLVFFTRVKYYASYFALYCGILVSFLVVELFANGTRTAIHILAVVVFDLLVFVALLSLIVSSGGDTNSMHLEHGATLARKKMALSSQLGFPKNSFVSNRSEKLRSALEVLQTVSEAVAWDNSISQVTFLGFTAGSQVIGLLVGFGGAAIGIAAQQLTSRIS